MRTAHAWKPNHTRSSLISRLAACAPASVAALVCGLLLVVGCTTTSLTSPFARKPSQTTQPAAPAPTSQTQPAGAAATEPADPTQQLAQEVQQYVSNLPMDDLQAKLSRREGQPAPAAVLGSEEHAAGTDRFAPAPAGRPEPGLPASAAPSTPATAEPAPPARTAQHVPLQPEIAVPAPQATAPRPAESVVPAKDTRIVDIEIGPAALASASPKPDPAAKQQPNQAASVKSNAGSSAGDLKDLLEQLRKEAAGRPDSVGTALRLRLAEWSLTGQMPSGKDWPLQDAEKRRLAESVWQVLQVVSRTDGLSQRSSSEEFEKTLESLDDTLRQVQPLKIPSTALCWSVENFGHYEPLPGPWKFPAGQTSMVVLYCELAGFRSEASTDKPGWYRTLLGERLAILTADGKELWNYDEPSIEDLCHRPRRDFFVTKKLRIPGNLPAGPYVLKVTIRDQIANRVTEANVPFEIESIAAQ